MLGWHYINVTFLLTFVQFFIGSCEFKYYKCVNLGMESEGALKSAGWSVRLTTEKATHTIKIWCIDRGGVLSEFHGRGKADRWFYA